MIAKVLGISQQAVFGVIKRSRKWVVVVTWPLILRKAIQEAVKLGRKIHCEAPIHNAHHSFGVFRIKIKVGVDQCGNPKYKWRTVPCKRKHIHVRCWYGKKGGGAPFLNVPIPFGKCSRQGFWCLLMKNFIA
jgi:hypothetical protein